MYIVSKALYYMNVYGFQKILKYILLVKLFVRSFIMIILNIVEHSDWQSMVASNVRKYVLYKLGR